jgi:hypothetical protein
MDILNTQAGSDAVAAIGLAVAVWLGKRAGSLLRSLAHRAEADAMRALEKSYGDRARYWVRRATESFYLLGGDEAVADRKVKAKAWVVRKLVKMGVPAKYASALVESVLVDEKANGTGTQPPAETPQDAAPAEG